ncbi:unnamed protein product [Prorocentrum cordatum]|uniref:Uncharacterized protein n=1 Tax=Prorocentrum cordatum TaxID=2364126 RepID=A0ABN9UTT1_9DINO|nr:unnamed protein product [Polarella glacialis]
MAVASPEPPPPRRGIVYDKWPFRMDVDVEYQDWVLVLVCLLLAASWALPCMCGHLRSPLAQCFSKWVYTRLHVFYCGLLYVSLIVLMFTLVVLPDWTVNSFLEYLVLFVVWVLIHLQKMVTSTVIIIAFYTVFRFRERLALASGFEYLTVFHWDWRDYVGFVGRKRRPIEVFIWKVEGLHSSSGKVLKANDLYIECHMGHNEPVRTRVHNNAGSGCTIQQSFQLNIDESSRRSLMTLMVRDQALMGRSSELARLMLSTHEICGIEDKTGKRHQLFTYSAEHFVELKLSPAGTIWVAIAPVEEGDAEERALLMTDDEDALVTC